MTSTCFAPRTRSPLAAALRRRLWRSVALACLLITALPVIAQTASRETPTAEQLQARIKNVEASAADAPARARLLELYRRALDQVTAAEGFAKAAREFQEAAAAAPDRLRHLQAQIEALPETLPADQTPLAEASLEALEQALTESKARLASLQGRVSDLTAQLVSLQARPPQARQDLAEAKARQNDIEQQLRAPVLTGNEQLRDARETALLAERLASQQQIRMLEQELLSLDVRQALVDAERALAAAQVERQSQQVRELESLANQRSLAEGAEAIESAQQAVSEPAGAAPLVRDAAAANARLSEELSALVLSIEESSRRQRDTAQQLDRVSSRYRSAQQQLDIAGLSTALGEVLRRERRKLPSAERFTRRVDERQAAIAEARLRQFQLDEQRPTPADIERQVGEMLRDRPPGMSADAVAQSAEQLQRLLTDRAALQEKLSINYGRLVDELVALNRDEQALVIEVQRYRELLDQSLFWIASAAPISLAWVQDIGRSLVWLLNTEGWRDTISALLSAVQSRPLSALACLVAVLLLLRGRKRLLAQLSYVAKRINTPEDRFSRSLVVLLDTLLLALPWPLLIGGIGWLVDKGADGQGFAQASGRGLIAVAAVALSIDGFRQLCRNNGLAQAHFNWRIRSRRVLRRNLNWLLMVSLPLVFLITLTELQPEELYRDGLGRLAFLLLSIAIAVFAWRVLRPGQLIFGRHRERRRGWWRLRRKLRPIAALVPLPFAALALYGYYYTALQLESRLVSTAWLLITAGILASLGLRWMRLARRRLAERVAHRQQAVVRRGRPRPSINLDSVDEQTRTLLRVALWLGIIVGLWLIWADLLPALNILEDVVLWHREAAEGGRVLAVTLGDVMLAVLTVALTLIAARNLPGALEITLLSRLEMDAGNRYTITSVSRYLIAGIGLLTTINLIGVDWAQAQWLIAALGVGLGFGLQEIFANFVSGLILLFERPIRVGDEVSVGALSGRVTQIRSRATIITDWERREIIIPNKAFITGQVINWTLSDQVTRVTITLAVAHGSPPDEARAMLLEVAAANPRVMRQPAPFAYIVSLEENDVKFDLCVFVATIDDRLPVAHEIYTEITRRQTVASMDKAQPQPAIIIDAADRRPDPPLS